MRNIQSFALYNQYAVALGTRVKIIKAVLNWNEIGVWINRDLYIKFYIQWLDILVYSPKKNLTL